MYVKLIQNKISNNRIEYLFQNDTSLDRFFRKEIPFFIEYNYHSLNLSSIPNSILSVAFVTNLLPLAWLYDFTIEVDELDSTFYSSIEKIKQGFQAIYPYAKLKGSVITNKLVDNSYLPTETVACLFSGGVDATYSALKHKDQHPILVNVWGVDIDLDDSNGHTEVDSYCRYVSTILQSKYICVKSSLRSFLNESLLNQESMQLIDDFWWHGAQHSIGLLSLLAPLDYLFCIKTNYIASSFTQKEFLSGVKCVSYPIVDNAFVVASTKTHHDGYDVNRSEKIQFICETCTHEDFTLDLKVCFNYINGKNCCHCEKCYRTMMDILVFDNHLDRYGFTLRSNNTKEIKRFLDTEEIRLFNWNPIQESYRKYPCNQSISWFAHYKFNNFGSLKNKILRRMLKIENILKGVPHEHRNRNRL